MAPDDSDDTGNGQDTPTYDPSQQPGVLGNYAPPAWDVPGAGDGQPSVFGDAFNPKPWTPADNSLNIFVDPATMKTIDFQGTDAPEQHGGPSQPSQPDASFTGLTPWQPDAADSQVVGAGAQPSGTPSSTLDYDGATHSLTLTRGDGTVQTFPANNNVDSHSQGHWPDGTFSYDRQHTHADDSPESAYGSYCGYGFDVPGRTNMEVHSGRESQPDGLGRTGVDHATNGCIRTTDDGVAAVQDADNAGFPVTSLTVRNNN